MPTRSASRAFGAPRSIPFPTRRPTPRPQALADRENLSDTLAGIEIKEDNHEVADILVDLIRRETHTFSVRFARSLVGELSTGVELINNPHRSAGFKVLKAPDVPSVLVELGYLSNAKDEEQLRDPDWRDKAADRIACGDRPVRRGQDCGRRLAARATMFANGRCKSTTVRGIIRACETVCLALPYFAHIGSDSVCRHWIGIVAPLRRSRGRQRHPFDPHTGAGMIRLIGYFFGIAMIPRAAGCAAWSESMSAI